MQKFGCSAADDRLSEPCIIAEPNVKAAISSKDASPS
jgi:hypothetical protein